MAVIKLACILIMLLSFSFDISQGIECRKGMKPERCPFQGFCYCPGHIPRPVVCSNGQWKLLSCEKTTQISTTEKTAQISTTEKPETCPELRMILFGNVNYSTSRTSHPFPLGTEANILCSGENHKHTLVCTKSGWSDKVPKCSCEKIQNVPGDIRVVYSKNPQNGQYPLHTSASYTCNNSESVFEKWKCEDGSWKDSQQKSSQWLSKFPEWQSECFKTTTSARTTQESMKNNIKNKRNSPESPEIDHTEKKTVVIVSSSTGAILGALIILVAIVSCQRRLHYHRLRRARLRHRQDQDAFTAFITYHRDARLMLPSYDEAMNQQQRQPPSFEEALGQENCPDTPRNQSLSSVSTDSPTSSASPVSETRSSPGNDSDSTPSTPSLNGESSVTPTSESSRFFRSLRMLFGGRSFRPDAIYCRFVPEENEGESSPRIEERESSDNSDDELTQVLTQVGLC